MSDSRDQLKEKFLSSSEGKDTLSKHTQDSSKSKDSVFGAHVFMMVIFYFGPSQHGQGCDWCKVQGILLPCTVPLKILQRDLAF